MAIELRRGSAATVAAHSGSGSGASPRFRWMPPTSRKANSGDHGGRLMVVLIEPTATPLCMCVCVLCATEKNEEDYKGKMVLSLLLHGLADQRWHKRVWFRVYSHFAMTDQRSRTFTVAYKEFSLCKRFMCFIPLFMSTLMSLSFSIYFFSFFLELVSLSSVSSCPLNLNPIS